MKKNELSPEEKLPGNKKVLKRKLNVFNSNLSDSSGVPGHQISAVGSKAVFDKWAYTPYSLLQLFFKYLNISEVHNVLFVCKNWKTATYRDKFWKHMDDDHQIQIERSIIRGYVEKIYHVFDPKERQIRINNIFCNQDNNPSKDEEKDDLEENLCKFLTTVPESLEVPMMRQFFEEYPRFNVIERESDDGSSLPILLYDWGQTKALGYVLEKFPDYDTLAIYGCDVSLSELKEKPSIHPKNISLESAQSQSIFTTRREVFLAQKYANSLYDFFKKDHMNAQLDAYKLKGFDEKTIEKELSRRRKNCLPQLSSSMQKLMIKEFLLLYPNFDIYNLTIGIQTSLPFLLWDAGQKHALEYLLSVRSYDENCEEQGTVSLAVLMKEAEAEPTEFGFQV